MGIPGLTSFMKQRFTRWLPLKNFEGWDHLLIDGSGICYTLYYWEKFRWDVGGEYDKFSGIVQQFFQKARFRNPIVVFDGCAGHDEKKIATSRDRREQSMKEMWRVQRQSHRVAAKESASSKPLMLISAFMDVLRQLGIEFHVVDGEADAVIAALANHYKCPVLGSDSDYFMFDLKCGFIHFDRYYKQGINNSLFTIREFTKQFRLKCYELCLILPSTFGNDFATSSLRRSHHDYGKLLEDLSKFRSCREYFDRNWNATTHANFEAARRFYRDLPLPESLYVENAPTTNEKFTVLPQWVFKSFSKGCFPPFLVNVFHNRLYLLPLVVEAIEMDSAWLTSRGIRQYLYGIMGLSAGTQVVEVLRKGSVPAFTEELVSPKLQDPITCISDQCFSDRNEKRLSDLVLSVLSCSELCPDDKFNSLESKWKLPIAATFYWYRNLTDDAAIKRKDLLMAILLSFFACSNLIDPSLPSHAATPSTRSAHLTALHAFAQWQCVYYDARALNYLAREPFPTTSPAFLYSGEVAMHYAIVPDQGDWLAQVIAKGSNERLLFDKFVYLITQCDDESSSAVSA